MGIILAEYIAVELAVTEQQRIAERLLQCGIYRTGSPEWRGAVDLAWDAAAARAKARRRVKEDRR